VAVEQVATAPTPAPAFTEISSLDTSNGAAELVEFR
jgi:hypothetical protein